ncbi:Rieske (2Fe-2S) protein [Pontibacter anaerobius]|uniref:Rieske 2Fe-2S domain-containing protein n=1 Tax=Pontibacter anaerobius TaxID=2993940 RepID=A0ABT3RLD7_9BACT|nr:Rieske 2Fe-2S domain-containing protein [Pontibacter anaerobius]MCX2742000.1 Rieske 2Fe-2S domain-containing protein [Pontibacter anaerobius]
MRSRFLLLLPLLVILAGSCKDSNNSPIIPTVPVSAQLNVNSQLYPDLRQDGGYAYLPEGYKGIIVVRQNAGSYLAFERTCTYDPGNDCKLEVDPSRLYITDPCCGSQFNLQGQVIGGPAISALRQYRTSLVASTLYISN